MHELHSKHPAGIEHTHTHTHTHTNIITQQKAYDNRALKHEEKNFPPFPGTKGCGTRRSPVPLKQVSRPFKLDC